jgi:hypothetical protein
MLFKVNSVLKAYIEPTEFCDCRNDVIIKKSNELIGQTSIPKDAAIKIFNFVRDEIPFEANRADERASETLQRGSGFCITKSNLQIALLRAIGIPARYHHVHLKKVILNGVIRKAILKYVPDIITYHPWCECYINDNWVACEALYHKELIADLRQGGFITYEQIPSIDWDGETDLILCAPWIVGDLGVTQNMDNVFRKAQVELSSMNQ